EERLGREPTETLYVADDRQTATEAIALAFAYARAQAQLLAKLTAEGETSAKQVPSGTLSEQLADVDSEVKAAQAEVKDLQSKLASASGKERRSLQGQIASVQSQLALSQARADALHSVAEFEGGNFHPENATSSLMGQIDELERSIPELARTSPAQPGAQVQSATPIA